MNSRAPAFSLAASLLVATLLSIFCESAAAQPADNTSAQDAEGKNASAAANVARKLYLEGDALLRAGKHKEACAALRAALRLKKAYQITAALGACELGLGHHVEAAKLLAWSLELAPVTVGVERREHIIRLLVEATGQVATVSLSTNVSCQVSVDGEPIDKPKRKIYLSPGEHTFGAERKGYQPQRQTLTLAAGTEHTISLMLEPLATETIVDDSSSDSDGDPEPLILWVGYGVATATLVTGSVLAGLANDKDSEADDLLAGIVQERGDRPCEKLVDATCNEIFLLRGDQDIYSNSAFWMYMVSGTLTTVTTAYLIYMLVAAEPNNEPAMIAPSLFIGGGGLSVSTAW